MTPRARRVLAGIVGFAALGAAGFLGPAIWARGSAAGRIYSAEQLGEVPATAVALVLGAEVSRDGRPSLFLKARLDLAAQLHQRGVVQTLLVSGDGADPTQDEPAAMREYLLAAGLPAGDIVTDDKGFDTYRSCKRAREVFGAQQLLVVSQRYHLPRALAICRALGIEAVGVGDDSASRYTRVWRRGVLREVAAGIKAVWDVTRDVSVRDPGTGYG